VAGVNASIISSSWVRLIYVGFCEITRAITTKSEHTDHWTKMLRPFALFSGSVPSRHIRSSAGFTITTCVFEFSVHTGTSLLPLAIFLPVIIGAPLFLLSKRVGQVLDAMPVTWLVALQLYRVFGSVFLAAGLRGAGAGRPDGIRRQVDSGIKPTPITNRAARATPHSWR
jgi:hypothetical protein